MQTQTDRKFILEPYSGPRSRYSCPQCGKKHEFARYIDQQTGEHLADNVGRCNREVHCGYHYTPKQYREDNRFSLDQTVPVGQKWDTPYMPPKIVSQQLSHVGQYLPGNLLEKTMKEYDRNNFYQFLVSLFLEDVAAELAATYRLGTSQHWPGANIFWQMDAAGNLRQAKIMLYDPFTGRRVREGEDKVYYAGKKILNDYEANLQQCFFGEHLLTIHPRKPVAIVESEKTAMVASMYIPQRIWLATGGSHGCKWTSPEVCRVLQRREVILFPDLGFFDKWQQKAEAVRKAVSCRIVVSDLLEKNGTDAQRAAGWDLADYLLLNRDSTGLAMTGANYPLIWDIKQELKIES